MIMLRRSVPEVDTPVTDIAGRISPRNSRAQEEEGSAANLPTTHLQNSVTPVETHSSASTRRSSVEISESTFHTALQTCGLC